MTTIIIARAVAVVLALAFVMIVILVVTGRNRSDVAAWWRRIIKKEVPEDDRKP